MARPRALVSWNNRLLAEKLIYANAEQPVKFSYYMTHE